MIAISLQSGSNGNCIYIETGGLRLLFDAGISGVEAERRLAAYGRNIRDVNALIISHDHADHARCAGVYHRKYGMPVFITSATLETSCRRSNLGGFQDVRFFKAGETLDFGPAMVHTIPTPHDGVDGSVFIIEAQGKRLGIMTDLGYVFDDLCHAITTLDAVFMESNYDPDMLADGPYPAFLKKRIKGEGGHISNIEAAELLKTGRRLKWACLSHLSEENNHPDIAMKTHQNIADKSLELYIASRYKPSGIFQV